MGLAGLPGGGKPTRAGRLILPASRPVQELGTIEAGSKELTTASDDEGRPPPRSKSIRRSKALERRNG